MRKFVFIFVFFLSKIALRVTILLNKFENMIQLSNSIDNFNLKQLLSLKTKKTNNEINNQKVRAEKEKK